MESPRREVARGVVEPFGEYARRVFGIPPFHSSVDLADPVKRVSVVCPCAATLFLYGEDKDKLSILLDLWHSSAGSDAVPSANTPDDEMPTEVLTSSSFAAPSQEQFRHHVLAQLHHCLTDYFSTNWDRSKEVVTLNNSYRDYIGCLYDQLAGCATGSPEGIGPLRIADPPAAIRDAALHEAEFASPKTSAAFLDSAITSQNPGRILVLFHAPFSERSIKLLAATRAAASTSSPEVALAVVNVASQLEIVHGFDVQRYPTLILLSPDENKSAPLALSDYARREYPPTGSFESRAIAAWTKCDGLEAPPLTPPTGPECVSALPRDDLQLFALRREEHSNKVIQRRLGCTDESCIAPRHPTDDNPPRFIFLGGGMASGKTTSTAALAATDWWKTHGSGVVIVNADEFKYTDSQVGDLRDPTLHSYSTKKAEELLVSAVNGMRDVVFDGTMMWAPFVSQVVAMVRGASTDFYKNGRGWLPDEGVEEYFVRDSARSHPRIPYRVELVGAFADPVSTVPRAIVRELRTGRNVPTKQQLRSYKLFAQNFDDYVALVDEAVLYNTDVLVDVSNGEVPPVAARKLRGHDALEIVDAAAFAHFRKHCVLNEDAGCATTLFKACDPPA